jgi:hypothetical protein
LCAADLDYWALGHVHRRNIVRSGDPWIVYPGNLQGRSPQPGERDAKGAMVVEVEGGRIASVDHVALDRVRFAEAELDADSCSDLGELEEQLTLCAESQRASAGARGLMLRVRIRGADERLLADLKRRETLADLTSAVRDRCAGLEPFLWWDALQIDTAVLANVAVEGVDGVGGVAGIEGRADGFAESLREVCASVVDDPDQSAALIESSFEKLPSRRAGIELSSLAAVENSDLLREGRELALSLLMPEVMPEISSELEPGDVE